MLTPERQTESGRNLRRERRLWHDQERHTPSIGCTSCPDRAICGGLQLAGSLYDCLSFCCHTPDDCDAVCRYRPDAFAERVREVDGFSFDNIPRAPVIAAPFLPPLVPVLYHGCKRIVPFEAPAVCLPLYSVIDRRNGETRYSNGSELSYGFGIGKDVPVMLTGTATDGPLERWWSLGEKRRERIRALRNLGVTLVTTPNYSLFVDQPRWDDLHSLKRIAIVHEEFLREGVPAALHINARTDRDWDRWTDYIERRPEVTHIAFEFATGAGWALRTDWHVKKLVALASSVGRPLHLVMRGGTKMLPVMTRAFADITFLETSVFMKTAKRQRAFFSGPGVVNWKQCRTKKSETIDSLLSENWQVVSDSLAGLLTQRFLSMKACG